MFKLFLLPGLDDTARQFIETYWQFLCAWFQEHLLPRVPDLTVDLWRDHQALQEPFDMLKKDVTKADAKNPTAIRNGILRWDREFLLPLAQQLDLRARVEVTVLQNCWRRDHFSRWNAGHRKLEKPPEEEKERIFQRPREIFKRFPSRTGKKNYIDALVDPVHGLCRDRQTAEVVGGEYKRIEARVAGLTNYCCSRAIAWTLLNRVTNPRQLWQSCGVM
jgi:hypothetical protein